MKKIIVLITTTIGSGAGWWLGARIGMMTAFILSMVGFGIGMYYGNQYAKSVDV